MYLGEYRIDDYVTLIATTHRFSSGAAYAPTAITYRVYEDATDVEIVADTAMTNFDTETGFYLNRIQCTAALGYEAGKTYTALIKATVDSVAAITAYTWRILTPPVNVTQVAGTAQTAGDLAAMITTVDDFVDTEITAIKTKTDFLPSVTAGAAGGLMIAGSNAATTFATLTVTGASIFTGNVSYAAGITITQSTVNGHGISITGNGIGHGVKFIGGDTGSGAHFVGGATSGHAVNTEAASGYSGFNGVGVGGGYGFRGSMEFLPAALIGGRINADATAISGDSVAADRLETMLDGTGGNTLSAAITGNITGNLSGSVGSVTGAVGSVTGDVGGNVTGSVGSIASNGINNNSLHSNACSKITDSGIQRGASNWENNSDDRSLGWAISKLVNKIDLNAAGDTLTIRKSNDSTALFTQSVTTSGGAAPVVSLDTA